MIGAIPANLASLVAVAAIGIPAIPAERRHEATAPVGAVSTSAVPKPRIVHDFIPYGVDRRRQMAAYAKRHYGKRDISLRPRLIVEHWTASNSTRSALSIFRANRRDPEFGSLPGVCAHFLIERSGRILNLVPVDVMCRHATGLNDRAIGIEHVGTSDRAVMSNHAQITASIQLTRWLRCRFDIELRDVIGHNENLSSRWYHERVASWRGQTHEDMKPATMRHYRRIVARRGCP